jgi:hypothetical protein
MTGSQGALDELKFAAKGANLSMIRVAAVRSISELACSVSNSESPRSQTSSIAMLTELLKHSDSGVVNESIVGL